MQKRTEELAKFIEDYGIDFLGDGTKKGIVDALKNGNDRLALQILKSIDKNWMDRAKEIHTIYLFTDYLRWDYEEKAPIKAPIYKTSYLGSPNPNLNNIPVLRRIRSKEFYSYDPTTSIDRNPNEMLDFSERENR